MFGAWCFVLFLARSLTHSTRRGERNISKKKHQHQKISRLIEKKKFCCSHTTHTYTYVLILIVAIKSKLTILFVSLSYACV